MRPLTTRTITELPPTMDLAILERLIEDLDAAASCTATTPQAWAARLRAVGERDTGHAHGILQAHEVDPRDPLPWPI